MKLTYSLIGFFGLLMLFMLTRGIGVYSTQSITAADSVRVQISDFKTLKVKLPFILRQKHIDLSAVTDTSNVILVEVVNKPRKEDLSEGASVQRIEQYYYNTYDKLISTLTILLTIFSVVVAFFGGIIPYIRSEKAEKTFNTALQRLTDQEKRNIDLESSIVKLKDKAEIMGVKNQELYDKLAKIDTDNQIRIEKVAKRSEILRRKIPTEASSLEEVFFKDNKKTGDILEKHYLLTETLLNLGVELTKDDYVTRSVRCILVGADSELNDELENWLPTNTDTVPLSFFAYAYHSVDKHEKAITYFNQVTDLNEGDGFAWMIKGLSHFGMEHYREAVECLSKAITIFPDNTYCHYIRAAAYAYKNQKNEMLGDLEFTISKDKNYVNMIQYNTAFNEFRKDPDFIAITSIKTS